MTLLRDWFSTAGLEVARLSTCNSLSVILRLTMAGAGVSLLPTAILPRRSGANGRGCSAPTSSTKRGGPSMRCWRPRGR